ncbi:aminomethyl transferase family protein [Bosea sp. 685]|uniref:aminomethyl transferase family protein n=1 Tax=Bosea sp. 685 TaxID=3080057 RepID=UPI0028934566|nr:aminomethyl transferase family protein [Bosea sp. 685]WNJ88046.1 aminomethyl transferase family protein [Bosea sp. 685]
MNQIKGQPSLEEFLKGIPDLVDYFYNDTTAPHSKDRSGLTPVPAEFGNWVDEQKAWRDGAVLFDQSHHMPELFLKGPDAFRMLNRIGINSFEKFVPGKAKQFVACNHDGHMIGECVLFYLGENSFELVSGMHMQNWVEYHATTGGYDVTIERDLPTSVNPQGRTQFRFGLDGPASDEIFAAVIEGPEPNIPFFNFARVRIAGCDVLALRHGMAGGRGVELAGRIADGPKVRETLLKAGASLGLRPGGTLAYFSGNSEGGWMPYPLPAVYTAAELKAYREWLPSNSWESSSQLGGSFRSQRIEDYYVTPWDMGYDRILKFDHDFIGSEALQRAAEGPRRTAVTLVWNVDDVVDIFRSQLEDELPYKQLRFPMASYSFQQNDEVRDASGELIGLSNFCGYSANERKVMSLANIARDRATPGLDVTVTWGEPDGGSRKRHVERHRQKIVRAQVAPWPYAMASQRRST